MTAGIETEDIALDEVSVARFGCDEGRQDIDVATEIDGSWLGACVADEWEDDTVRGIREFRRVTEFADVEEGEEVFSEETGFELNWFVEGENGCEGFNEFQDGIIGVV